MLNVKGLFGVLSVLSLVVFVPIGLMRFAIDWWDYSQTFDPAQAKMNYRGLVLADVGVFWCAVFLIAFSVMHWRFKRRIGKRN